MSIGKCIENMGKNSIKYEIGDIVMIRHEEARLFRMELNEIGLIIRKNINYNIVYFAQYEREYALYDNEIKPIRLKKNKTKSL